MFRIFTFLASIQVDSMAKTVIFGFTNGTIHVTCFDVNESHWDDSSIHTTQTIKPHVGQIKGIRSNDKLLFSVSEDQTIFMLMILQSANGVQLSPFGFVPTNAVMRQIICAACDANKVNIIALLFPAFNYL